MARIFLDSCIVIDLVEGTPEQQNKLKTLIAGKEVFGSELVRMESRLQAVRDRRHDLLNIYDAYFGSCLLVPFDRPLFDLASRLRIDHHIKTPDALHLAAALTAECKLGKGAGLKFCYASQNDLHREAGGDNASVSGLPFGRCSAGTDAPTIAGNRGPSPVSPRHRRLP